MKESRLVLLQYLTGIIILILGALHYASLTFLGVGGYDQAIRYDVVINKYKDMLWSLMLGAFLTVVTIHTFIGFRNILIELNQGKKWELFVNLFMVLIGCIVLIYGLRTIMVNLV